MMKNPPEKEALNLLSCHDFVPRLPIKTMDGEWSDSFFTGRSDVVMVFALDNDVLRTRACKLIVILLTVLCLTLIGLLPDADDGSFTGTDFSDPGAAVVFCLLVSFLTTSLWVTAYQYFHTLDNHVALTDRGVEVHLPLPPSCFLSHYFSTRVLLYKDIRGILLSSEVVKVTNFSPRACWTIKRRRRLPIVGLQDPGSFVSMVCTEVKAKTGNDPDVYRRLI